MNTEKENQGTGQAFTDQQTSTDQAINERIKEEQGKEKIDPSKANNKNLRGRQSDTPEKKTGVGKQKNPGM
jgi:hypothetical protein